MRLLRGLIIGDGPRHLRELADTYALSPAGVSDIIRRLRQIGVLKEARVRNKRYFTLNLSSHEHECLKRFFADVDKSVLESRAKRFSRNAAQKLQWMDDAYKFYRNIKKSKV